MRRHDDTAMQAEHDRWNEAVIRQADHRIDCTAGCSILGDVCPAGLESAAAEQAAWRTYYDIRTAEVRAP